MLVMLLNSCRDFAMRASTLCSLRHLLPCNVRKNNVDQDEYVDWLLSFTIEIKRVLKSTGSFVLDLGGAYCNTIPAFIYKTRIT